MVSLSAARGDAVTALQAAGLRVFTYAPARASGRFAVVTPADPYLSAPVESVPFRNYVIDLLVFAAIEKGDNQATDDKLDEHIQAIVTALDTSPYDVVDVSGPGDFAVAGTTVVGAVIGIRSFINLGD